MKPEQSKLADLPGRGQDVTAKGKDSDCVSRSFFPKLLVAEGPVCGSAHCQIADYWSIDQTPAKSDEEIIQEVAWCEKMLARTVREDAEGSQIYAK